jgi:purine nucleosidase
MQTGEVGISLPDPVAMAIALDPSICTSASEHFVDVEVAGELTRGMTVVDRLGVAGDERNRAVWKSARKTRVCWTIDNSRWKNALYSALVAR